MNHRFLIDFCVFYSLFFRGPCVDYREILSVTRAHGVTLNKRFYYYYYYYYYYYLYKYTIK